MCSAVTTKFSFESYVNVILVVKLKHTVCTTNSILKVCTYMIIKSNYQ